MPVRSSNSSVLVWPDLAKVDRTIRSWVLVEAAKHPELRRLAYYGSYARGDWGVGSDLDLLAIIENSAEPFDRRSLSWDLGPLPVPADLLVYTVAEWEQMIAEGGRFARTVEREAIWVYPVEVSNSGSHKGAHGATMKAARRVEE